MAIPLYLEKCVSLNNRGTFIPSKQLASHLKENQELYRSLFFYDETMTKRIKKGEDLEKLHGRGKFYLPHIVIDVDRGEDSFEEMLLKIKNFANVLIKEYDLEGNFQLWFSGTGFHFVIPNIFDFQPSNHLPGIVRATIEAVFPIADTKIYHKRGLIRVGGSMNLKTSLYKIPIREHEIWFLTEEQVLEWSSKNRKINLFHFKDFPLYPDLIVFPQRHDEKNFPNISTAPKPSNIVTCAQRILAEGPVVNTRHERLLRIASWLKRASMPLDVALAVATKYTGENTFEWVHVVNSVYTKEYEFGCNDYVLKQFCDPTCIYFEKKNYLPEIFGLVEIQKKYNVEMAAGWKENSLDISEFFNIRSHKGIWLRPGHVIGIIADTGNSKSSLIQNLCIRYKDFGKILYLDTEMTDTELYERFLQIENKMDSFEVRERVLEDGNGFGDSLGHIKYLKNVPTYENLVPILRNMKPKILVIDVVDDLRSKSGRDVSSQEDMFAQFKKLLNELGVITFLVHHVTKSAVQDADGKPKKITKHAAKGSSAFEQKCDLLIGIDGDSQTPYRTVRHLKGRSTAPFTTKYRVDPDTFVYEIKEEEEEDEK